MSFGVLARGGLDQGNLAFDLLQLLLRLAV
jgi:hypothetical protein